MALNIDARKWGCPGSCSIHKINHESVDTVLETGKPAKQRRFDIVKHRKEIPMVCQVDGVHTEANLSFRRALPHERQMQRKLAIDSGIQRDKGWKALAVSCACIILEDV